MGRPSSPFLSFSDARKVVQKAGLRSYREWTLWSKTERPATVPSTPQRVYKGEYVNMGDFCGYDRFRFRGAHWRTSLEEQQAIFRSSGRAAVYELSQTAYDWFVDELQRASDRICVSRAPYDCRATLFYRFTPGTGSTAGGCESNGPDPERWLPVHVSAASLRQSRKSHVYNFHLTNGFGLPGTIETVFVAAKEGYVATPEEHHFQKRLTRDRKPSELLSVQISRTKLSEMSGLSKVVDEMQASWDVCGPLARPVLEWLPDLVAGTCYKKARYELLREVYRHIYEPWGASLRVAPYTRHGSDFLVNGKPVLHRVLRRFHHACQWRVGLGKYVGRRKTCFPYVEEDAPDYLIVYDCEPGREALASAVPVSLRGVWIFPRCQFQDCLAVSHDMSSGSTALNVYPPDYRPRKRQSWVTQQVQLQYYIDLSTAAARAVAWKRASQIFGQPARGLLDVAADSGIPSRSSSP